MGPLIWMAHKQASTQVIRVKIAVKILFRKTQSSMKTDLFSAIWKRVIDLVCRCERIVPMRWITENYSRESGHYNPDKIRFSNRCLLCSVHLYVCSYFFEYRYILCKQINSEKNHRGSSTDFPGDSDNIFFLLRQPWGHHPEYFPNPWALTNEYQPDPFAITNVKRPDPGELRGDG